MSQARFGFQYEQIKDSTSITSFAGMAAILDLIVMAGLPRMIREQMTLRRGGSGWSDAQHIISLICLNIAGGSAVSDLDVLNDDAGLMRMVAPVDTAGMAGAERRNHKRRMKPLSRRSIPSQSGSHRYLAAFHDASAEDTRVPNTAFIPSKTDGIQGLDNIRAFTLKCAQQCSPQRIATLDMDATLCATDKDSALYCYKKFKSYQPLNVYWAEHQVLVHSEFRDGNVPAGYNQLRLLEESLDFLPDGVEKVQMRSDSAGYQWDLLKYCAEGKNERFGVINFAVAASITDSLRQAVAEVVEEDWQRLMRHEDGTSFKTKHEWAEVCFVPNASATKRDGPAYRFIVTREKVAQLELPGLDPDDTELPFPTVELDNVKYKLRALVTNRTNVPGDEVIWWSRERCGQSELAHAIMKTDLAGGTLPSDKFGANAAWWGIMTIAFNLVAILRRYILTGEWTRRRLKALRFALFRAPGWITTHARQLRLRVSERTHAVLVQARERMVLLLSEPDLSG